jgi:probable HAF family extracellular repeat protein
VCAPATVGAVASDPNGDALTYAWSVTSGPAGATITGSGATVSLAATTVGDYQVNVVVSDPFMATATLTFAVHMGACAACQPPTLIDLGVLLDGTTSTAVDLDESGDVLVLAPNSRSSSGPGFWWSPQTGPDTVLFVDPSILLSSFVAVIGPDRALATGSINGGVGAGRGLICSGNCFALPTLGASPSAQSSGSAANKAGFIVGSATSDLGSPSHAVLYDPMLRVTDLGSLDGSAGFSSATAIAPSSNTVVGNSSNHAFLWTAARGMRDLGTLGGSSSSAAAINDAGQVVGTSTTAGNQQHAFLWTAAGGMRDLGTLGGTFSSAVAINASGQVVGTSTTATANHAFFWSAGTMQDLGTLGGSSTSLSSLQHTLNDAGQVVGSSTTAAGQSHAFVWRAGVMLDLGTLGGASSSAVAINASGQIAGNSATATSSGHAFASAAVTCP